METSCDWRNVLRQFAVVVVIGCLLQSPQILGECGLLYTIGPIALFACSSLLKKAAYSSL